MCQVRSRSRAARLAVQVGLELPEELADLVHVLADLRVQRGGGHAEDVGSISALRGTANFLLPDV